MLQLETWLNFHVHWDVCRSKRTWLSCLGLGRGHPCHAYVGQLAANSSEICKVIRWMMTKLCTGPGNWLPATFLTDLKTFGFPAEIRDIHKSVQASKIRYASRTSLDFETLRAEVGWTILRHRGMFGDHHPHSFWHRNLFVDNGIMAKHGF